ncbi:MAG: hypothetical protein QM532_02405 [Cyanobium sp. MAG06]|nr:hypothetical protein [Cyanobium sp. MAG06]
MVIEKCNCENDNQFLELKLNNRDEKDKLISLFTDEDKKHYLF